jgi:nitrate reductase gamma subunit
MLMGKALILAAYSVYAAFWIRVLMHAIVWFRAVRRMRKAMPSLESHRTQACGLALTDVFFLNRLLRTNPALWFGEWAFHVSFLLVLLRHLRFFLNPIPSWVWSLQLPGLIAGYCMPLSLLYILSIRIFSKRERYVSWMNAILLVLALLISSIGVAMHAYFKPNLVDVKLFVFGLTNVRFAPAPESLLFLAHFVLVLAFVAMVPTHIVTAPLIMLEARKRELALPQVMHDQ